MELLIRSDYVFFYRFMMSNESNCAENDEVESHAPVSDQGASQSISGSLLPGSDNHGNFFSTNE